MSVLKVKIINKTKNGPTIKSLANGKIITLSWDQFNKDFIKDDLYHAHFRQDIVDKIESNEDEYKEVVRGFIMSQSKIPKIKLTGMMMLGEAAPKYCQKVGCSMIELVSRVKREMTESGLKINNNENNSKKY